MPRIEVPFLVVGAGPVGMMGGILLGAQRRRCLVVERRSEPQPAPAAHVVNARSFEICRQAGLDMAPIFAASQSPEDAGNVIFVTRLAGEEIGRLPFERQGDECLRFTPTPLRNLSQHRFEPILADAITKFPSVDLRYGVQWESSEQDEEGVTSTLRNLATDDTYEVRSRYVIAADGAGSRVRTSLGIEMQGPSRIRSFLMIHLGANLRPVVRDRLGVLHFVVDPEAGGVFVAHDIDREWVYMHEFDPDREAEDDFDEERCRSLVLRAIGRDVPMRILHRSSWHMGAQVADEMRDRRIFLAGDAAHRFPPTGGLGLNAGFQDVHGLVWKLCAVEDGWAPSRLLETYAKERRPVASENARQSLENAVKLSLLPQALGIDAEPTTARMAATLATPEGRRAVDEAIEAQTTHFDMLGLQLGYAYAEGALALEGSSPPALISPREFVPSSHPGARLPHAWLEANGETISSLDLVRADAFALFSWGEHERWAEAIAQNASVPCLHVRVGTDVVLPDESWSTLCEMEPGGALLVRPDQHVAWRAHAAPSDPTSALRRALTTILEG
ncbi:MAG: FAD-dependent monooxygenase [Deltaproteobacteria bacterium]|nr:FAD-dependent monooxygenase [Deltaproteobacteria bacterium]MBW2446607.1 FAD-dependent monooxygenase [Deltaproteobacteria bacterium]